MNLQCESKYINNEGTFKATSLCLVPISISIYLYLYIVVQPPIYASKQPHNLRHLLIGNTITDNEPECNKPFGKHRCKVCKHTNTATKVLINHRTVKPGNYNCDSANVVYLIHCQGCPEALYI